MRRLHAGRVPLYRATVVAGAEVRLAARPPRRPAQRLNRPSRSSSIRNTIRSGHRRLDGDGRYDFVLKTPRIISIPRGLWKPSPDTTAAAYSADGKNSGTETWLAIERGIWYSR